MANKHVHPTIERAMWPFFCVGVKTPTGERGCRIQAPTSHQATEEAVTRLRLGDEAVNGGGVVLKIKVSS